MHARQIVNVYNDYIDAINRATAEVDGYGEPTRIDVLNYMIYVTGERGEVVILVEELI